VKPPDESEMRKLADELARVCPNLKIKWPTCAEKIDLADSGIEHGKCIDDRLISELTGEKTEDCQR